MPRLFAYSSDEQPMVLIVDDTPNNLVVLELMLRDQFRVVCARSGEEALASIMHLHFDLILLDVLMPEMDGFQTLAAMQQRPNFGNTPVIFLTASTDIVDQKRGLSLGAVDYITKPFHRDIVLLRIQNILQRSRLQVRLELAITSSHLAFWSWQLTDGKIRFDEHAGLPTVTNWDAICHPDDLPAIASQLADYQAGRNAAFDVDVRFRIDTHGWHWVNLYGTAAYRTLAGDFEEITGTYRNVDVRKQAEMALKRSEERLRYVMEATGEGLWDWLIQENEITHNRSWCHILGLDDHYLKHDLETYKTIIHPDDAARVDLELIRCFGTDQAFDIDYRMRHQNGHYIWVNDRGRVVDRGEDGAPIRIVGSIRDITAQKDYEAEIRKLAFHDTLTGLPNRRLLMDRLQQALNKKERTPKAGALMFIDLDRFKLLNDTLGHDYGDMLLVQIGQRLSQCVRKSDTVARLGGDEFIVMLPACEGDLPEADAALQVAEKIRETLNAPYALNEHQHYSSPSIGITLFHGPPDTAEAIIKRADDAMYLAKTAGRNCVRFADAARTN